MKKIYLAVAFAFIAFTAVSAIELGGSVDKSINGHADRTAAAIAAAE
jgi:hypothetical protein